MPHGQVVGKCLVIIGYLSLLHLIFAFFYIYSKTDHVTDILFPRSAHLVANQSDIKIILLWTTLYRETYFGLRKTGRQPFVDMGCHVTNCLVTKDKSLLRYAAAVVIHNRHRCQTTTDCYDDGIRISDRQLFVYVSVESPKYTYITGYVNKTCKSTFNVTMTYRLDSDILIPYGYVRRRTKPKTVPPVGQDVISQEAFARKSGQVAWLVSHRVTQSRRERYAEVLSRYIQVDQFGRRGHANRSCASLTADQCMRMIASRYKFYLSFENSVCRDYVTEKYFRTLNYDVIPIVYGGADYRRIGPPGSFINILDYQSPKALARYLRHLATNYSAYLEYFKWRTGYSVTYYNTTGGAAAEGFCRLCEMVNTGYRKSYDDVCDWWTRESCDQSVVDRISSL